MRKRLSDITNSSYSSQQENHNNYNTLSLDNDSIQQLLKVTITLLILYNIFSSFSLIFLLLNSVTGTNEFNQPPCRQKVSFHYFKLKLCVRVVTV